MGKMIICSLFLFFSAGSTNSVANEVELGQASISLKVADILVSKNFYEKMGFDVILGDIEQKWLIMKHPANNAVIGLFEGHFENRFMFTFNPLNVRDVQKKLKDQGILFDKEAEPGTGPAYAVLKDPDNNTILLDQHN